MFSLKLNNVMILILLLFLNIQSLNASEKFNKLDDYLSFAEKNNNELKSLFFAWKSSVAKITRVQGLPDPKLSYSHFLKSVETKVGAQKNKYSLMQLFPWFGKLSLKGDVATSEAKVLEEKIHAYKLKLRYRVTQMYSKFYYLSKSIELTKENITLMHYFESVARTRYKTGQAPHSAIIKAQVEIGKLEDQLITLKSLQNPIVEKMNALLNRNRFKKLNWPQKIPLKNVKFNVENLHKSLLFKNPSLKILAYQNQKYKDSISLAKKQYFPDFSIGVSYVDTNLSSSNVIDNGKDALAIGITMTLPIWMSKNSAGVEQAKSMYKMIQYKTKQTKLNLKADLAMIVYEYNNNKRRINLYHETLIPKAEQSLRVTREAFESGKVNFLSLIDAERILLDFELLYHKSLSESLASFSEIEFIVGKRL